jgi:nucleolin
MTTALFVGDLSSCCSIDDIEKEFSKFGEIVDIRIKTDPDTKKRLSYGFVEYNSIECAEKAMQSLHGFVLCGRAMR